jgi:hypothetical protein
VSKVTLNDGMGTPENWPLTATRDLSDDGTNYAPTVDISWQLGSELRGGDVL